MAHTIMREIGKVCGTGFGNVILYMSLAVLLLYGCGGGGGGGGGGSETNNAGATELSIPITECVNPKLDISYDPDSSTSATLNTIVNLNCPAEKIALVVMGSNGQPTSKNYYLIQNAGGGFYIPKTIWDEVLQGASKGSYDIDLFVYESGTGKIKSIQKAGKVNLLNDYPPKD